MIISTLFLVSLQVAATAGTIQVGAGVEGEYNDNIFMNSTKVDDFMSRFFVDLNVPLKRLSFYLDASTDIYSENSQFNSYTVEPGMECLFPLKGKNQAFLNLSYRVDNYNEIYTDFNFSGPKAQLGVKIYTRNRGLLKLGLDFYSRNYANYDSFDLYNLNGFVEYSVFFKSQTTLAFQGGFNYRQYPHIADNVDFGNGYNYYHNMGNNGMGPGYGSDGSGCGGGNGHGNGNGQGNGNCQNDSTTSRDNQTHAYHVSNSYAQFKVKQALSTRLALTGEAEYRLQFNDLSYDDTKSLIKNAYVLFPYNDDFLWEGIRLSFGLQAVLIGNLTMQSSVTYYDKKYPGVLILDEEGEIITPETQRSDDIVVFRSTLSHRLGKFDLSANFTYRDNRSNDDYFQYKMIIASLGVAVYF